MKTESQIVPTWVLVVTAVLYFIASNQKPEEPVFFLSVLVIFLILFFVHRYYRRDPKPPETQLGKIWRSIETTLLEMPESTSEREAREAREKQEWEARETQIKQEREAREAPARQEREAREARAWQEREERQAREARERQEREAREAQEKQLRIARLEEIALMRAQREAREAREKQEREAAYEAFLVRSAAERKEREAREKQEREANMLRWEAERLEHKQARLLARKARAAARRAMRKEIKDKEKELAKLAKLEATPPDKPSETIADPIPDQSTRKRRSRSFPREDISNVADPSPASEGKRILKTNYAVVRNPKLRRIAIHIHGRNCIVCGFNFDRTFGQELAQGYIEVHHLKGIARGERSTDPEKDLVPLCANCHAMADRLSSRHESPPRSVIELKNLLFPAPLPSHYETPQTDATEES